jgi:hypothetical protein
VIGHPLQRTGGAGIVRIERQEKFSLRFTHRTVMRDMLPGVLLLEIANRKVGRFHPIGDQLRSAVGRAIVNDDPFEIAQRLCAQTFVHAMERVRPLIGRSEHRE